MRARFTHALYALHISRLLCVCVYMHTRFRTDLYVCLPAWAYFARATFCQSVLSRDAYSTWVDWTIGEFWNTSANLSLLLFYNAGHIRRDWCSKRWISRRDFCWHRREYANRRRCHSYGRNRAQRGRYGRTHKVIEPTAQETIESVNSLSVFQKTINRFYTTIFYYRSSLFS